MAGGLAAYVRSSGLAELQSNRSLPGPTTDRSVVPDNEELRPFEPSWWLRGVVDSITNAWETQGIEVCSHLMGDSPIGLANLADLPLDLRLRCINCAAGSFNATSTTCDRCHATGHIHPGIFECRLHGGRLAGRHFLLRFSLCPDCRSKEVGPDVS